MVNFSFAVIIIKMLVVYNAFIFEAVFLFG